MYVHEFGFSTVCSLFRHLQTVAVVSLQGEGQVRTLQSDLFFDPIESRHVAKFIVPDWGGDSGRVVVPARQAAKAGLPVRQPYAGVNFIPQSGTMNLATVHSVEKSKLEVKVSI